MAGISALLNPLFSSYDVLFQPVLALGPYISLAFFSLCLALLFSIIYYIFLDIEEADRIKEKISERQEQMKESDADPGENWDEMKETLKLNQEFMMLNLKPMLVTVVFVGLFFPWLGSTYSPQIDLEETGDGLSGQLTYAGSSVPFTANTSSGTLLMEERELETGDTIEFSGIDWALKSVDAEANSVKFSARFVNLPFSIPLAGTALNWLGLYFLMIMPSTYVFRKALGVQ